MAQIGYYSYFEAEDADGSIYYQFTTSYNLAYTVYFKTDEYVQYVAEYPLLLQKGYAFGFHKRKFDEYAKNTKDLLVFETIYRIALDFLTERGAETILLYHCDVNDDKQAGRNRLFNDWNKIASARQNITKHSIEILINSDTEKQKDMYLGFLTLSANPLIDEVKDEFESFSVNLITSK